jgi:Gluconolactonase
VAGGTAYVAGGGGLSAYHGGKLERLTGTPKQFSVAALGAVATVNGDTFLRSVLNQGGGRFAIAVFRQKPGGVEEIGRITSDEVQDPAAVVAADPERFYLVNRHEAKTALGRWLDDTLLLPRAHLLWFDGMKFVPVAEHLNTPSGLALSADGTRLFIAQDYPRTIAAMTRYEFSGAIENPAALNMPSGPLKLTVAGDGSLIVAARPKAGSGEVYRVVLENGQPKSASLLYAQKGEEVRAAAELPGTLLVGTSKALIACRIK